jgi:hypothetical protein
MKRSEAFPSRFISKDDVATPLQVTIESVEHDTVKDDNGDKIVTVMSFVESKPMIINNTNWMTIEDVWGDVSDNWIGKVIELYHDPSVMFGGKKVGGVRVRIPNTNAKPAQVLGGDPAMTFWAKAYELDISKADAKVILAAHGDNFANALADISKPKS